MTTEKWFQISENSCDIKGVHEDFWYIHFDVDSTFASLFIVSSWKVKRCLYLDFCFLIFSFSTPTVQPLETRLEKWQFEFLKQTQTPIVILTD